VPENPFYVYALKDPRNKNPRPFYIGKGTGRRAWEHELNPDDSDKGRLIRDIVSSGSEVLCEIIVDNLSEMQAPQIEAELISTFGIQRYGGLLTNQVRPRAKNIASKVKVHVPDGCYEKAQLGLEMLKAAILEFARSNPEGVKNADAAKYLGLQSNYGGGSKDYLSYSLLGLLMQDGLIKRVGRGNHVVA
jgi:hypothetical protein